MRDGQRTTMTLKDRSKTSSAPCETLLYTTPQRQKPGETKVWLLDKCIAHAKAHSHPGQTIWQMFEADQGSLVHYVEPFDAFHSCQRFIQSLHHPLRHHQIPILSTAVGRPVGVEGSRRKQCASLSGMLAASEVAQIMKNRVYLRFSSSPNLCESGLFGRSEAHLSTGDHKFTHLLSSLSQYYMQPRGEI